jgi:hypothetical protein
MVPDRPGSNAGKGGGRKAHVDPEGAVVNNDALVASLGLDAVAAVHGYRLAVLDEAERRGIRLASEALSAVEAVPGTGCHVVDPIDIRLAFGHVPGRPELAGRTLRWAPAHGWSLSHRLANGVLCYFASADAVPIDLVPLPPLVIEWAIGDADSSAIPPSDIGLDDDPEAVRRLLSYLDPGHRLPAAAAFAPTRDRADDPV